MSCSINRKINISNKGITLVALVITIIIMLILASVVISSVNKDKTIGHAKYSEEKVRAEVVEKTIKVWKLRKETLIDFNSQTTKDKEDIIQELQEDELITQEEANALSQNNTVTIGNKNINM